MDWTRHHLGGVGYRRRDLLPRGGGVGIAPLVPRWVALAIWLSVYSWLLAPCFSSWWQRKCVGVAPREQSLCVALPYRYIYMSSEESTSESPRMRPKLCIVKAWRQIIRCLKDARKTKSVPSNQAGPVYLIVDGLVFLRNYFIYPTAFPPTYHSMADALLLLSQPRRRCKHHSILLVGRGSTCDEVRGPQWKPRLSRPTLFLYYWGQRSVGVVDGV